jgi:putative ABC transport system ATP-binding protein
MNETPIIEVCDLWKTYCVGKEYIHALRGISLSVLRGEFLVVSGPSGSGKSTLIHVLTGLTPPSSGSVTIDGYHLDCLSYAELTRFRKKKIGFVSQKSNLFSTLSVEENISLVTQPPKKTQIPPPSIEQLLRNLGIANLLKREPSRLSRGQRQLVAIARAIVNKPILLLADEPTANLDRHSAVAVFDMLRDLNQRFKQTILIITHDPDIASYGGRKIELLDGQICN